MLAFLNTIIHGQMTHDEKVRVQAKVKFEDAKLILYFLLRMILTADTTIFASKEVNLRGVQRIALITCIVRSISVLKL